MNDEILKGPNFIGIGMHHAGTSWLYKSLYKHPEIWMPPVKELHFFDNYFEITDLNFTRPFSLFKKTLKSPTLNNLKFSCACRGHRDLSWYRNLFHVPNKLQGEITPAYSMLNQNQVEVVHREFPDLKIIMLYRDPVETTVSALKRAIGRGENIEINNWRSLQRLLETPRFKLRNQPSLTYKLWQSLYGKKFRVFDHSKLKSNPNKFLKDATDHLGIQPLEINNFEKRVVNSAPNFVVPEKTITHLHQYFESEKSEMEKILLRERGLFI